MRRPFMIVAVLLIVAGALSAQQPLTGARAPAFAADGRLAVSIAGDLWVLRPDGAGGWAEAARVTTGPAWDRDPAWVPDGSALVFASDRAGTIDLWRVALEEGAMPVRLTASPEHDVEPDVSSDGVVVFARGIGGDTDLWLRAGDGTERRLTSAPGAEREPTWAPDGERIAYVALRAGRRELRLFAGGRDSTVVADRMARAPAWAPDGNRIAFAGTGREPGIWLLDADGYTRLDSVPGRAAWSPDGAWLVAADLEPGDGGYNGDPDRLGERLAGDMFHTGGLLRRLAAAGTGAQALSVAAWPAPDRALTNAAAHDRVWSRVARLYYGADGPLLEAWREVGARHRPAAVAAPTGDALQDAVWAALRERPRRAGATGRAGVSSAHPLATAAGAEILELGGNVVDAAVAVSFALGVVEPDASGIGGYGQMLIHLAGMAEPTSLEFMTTSPAAAADSAAVAALPRSGPGAANVPGTVAGMELAWRRYGSGAVPWVRLLEPAIRLAEQGFELDDGFATTLRREHESFAAHAGSRTLYFRDGRPLAAGDTLRNPDLGWTLRQIAAHGAAALYDGAVGRRMVEELRAGGNLMTVEDVRAYRAVERAPVRGTYRGNDVFAGGPPVTGGAVLLGKLNLLERVSPGGPMTEDATTLHAMIEAWKLQPGTAGRIADPDLWPVDVTPFESKDTAAARWRCYDASRASVPGAAARADCGRGEGGSDRAAGGDDVASEMTADARVPDSAAPAEECVAHDRTCRGTGTTAFVVADAAGNIVSVTQTLGTWGGNFHVTPGLGFLYNDKLRSYGSNPNGYNARRPGARNTTVISPTIVFRGSGAAREPWFGVGAAGNAWITAAVYTAVVGIVDHGLGAQAALELPRFLAGGRGIQIEDGYAPMALRRLEAMGHAFERISLMGELRMGYGAAVVIGDGEVEAGGDPRRSGTGAAVATARKEER